VIYKSFFLRNAARPTIFVGAADKERAQVFISGVL
jgi:hypothetical protein